MHKKGRLNVLSFKRELKIKVPTMNILHNSKKQTNKQVNCYAHEVWSIRKKKFSLCWQLHEPKLLTLRFTCSSQTIVAELGHNQTLSRYYSHVINPETDSDSRKYNAKLVNAYYLILRSVKLHQFGSEDRKCILLHAIATQSILPMAKING